MTYKIKQGDCLELMQQIPSGSVDMILCDLPYGTTSNSWDAVIPFEQLWVEYGRIIKHEGRIVLFSAQPFTSVMIASNLKNFKHTWTWIKPRPTGFQNAKKMPLRATEDVCVFNGKSYYPQGLVRCNKICKNYKSTGGGNIRGDIVASSGKGSLRTAGREYIQEFTNYPRNILEFGLDGQKLHPTQKPVALCEYLIKTYTNEGEWVLDNCMGSGTTGVACINTNRNFIGIEQEEKYFTIAKDRLEKAEESAIQQHITQKLAIGG